MKEKEVLISFVLVLLGTVVIFYIPLVIIWSMNNLFHLDTPYNWKTWISVYILFSALGSISRNAESKEKIKPFWR